ncbi:uncharacterized protein LOC125238121 [Leguminivora glycinivorella]|uniref:uncharacterized protein LOC125238121 n=1 Tax=Leguminivora glycinivorella TaxID=1035111 RepID=UPI00200E74B7|nr:uncharacterized protein LOC125238121 [Leguminivora glycinivorella]
MCSIGTTTDKKQPTLDRILKENHIFLKYSKSCKSKKKRVRMDKKPSFFFPRRERECEPGSAESLHEATPHKPKRVTLPPIDNDNSSEQSEEDANLERKPARLILRASAGEPSGGLSGGPDPSDVSDASDDDSDRRSQISKRSSAPELSCANKRSRRPLQRQVPQLSIRAEPSQVAPKKPPCRVPKERLYFKNMTIAEPKAIQPQNI